MNNFEKIKTMTLDEMAEFLSEVSIRPCNICNAPLCKDGYICSEGWGWWLSRLQAESEG